jgi:proline iminopeptidase
MFITINDNALFVEDLGPRDGRPILIHHGGPGVGDHRSAKAAFEPLTDEYRVIVFDARGSGRSEGREPYTHEQWAADVECLRRHFGLNSFVMAGGSYGGFIAMEVAVR